MAYSKDVYADIIKVYSVDCILQQILFGGNVPMLIWTFLVEVAGVSETALHLRKPYIVYFPGEGVIK